MMDSKWMQTLLFAGAGVIALLFVKLMFDMSRSMSEMTAYVGGMSRDVGEMQKSMRTMNESLLQIERSVRGMGQAFGEGSQQFQQMNPAGMMQQMLPESGQRAR